MSFLKSISSLLLIISINIVSSKHHPICDKATVAGQLYDQAVAPLLNTLQSSQSLWDKLLQQLASFITSSTDIQELLQIINCVQGTSCPFADETSFLLDLLGKIEADSGYADRILNVAQTLESLNENTAVNNALANSLSKIDHIIESQCNVVSNTRSDLITAKTITKATDRLKILANIESVTVQDATDIESILGTLETVLGAANDLVGAKILSKILAVLGLEQFYDAILTTIEGNPDFLALLDALGNAFNTGTGIIGALNDIVDMLLSRNFIVSLSNLLNIQDLGTLLANLLEAVIALVVDVLIIVQGLLIALAQVVGQLAGILAGLNL